MAKVSAIRDRHNVLKAVLSLDGRLLTTQGKPRVQPIPRTLLEEAEELHLTLRPVVVSGKSGQTLSGSPIGFLPKEFRYALLSATPDGGGIRLRYRRQN